MDSSTHSTVGTNSSNRLEDYSMLTEHDYKFLQGDDKFWTHGGAALNLCYEWCRNRGYGGYGTPTEAGRKAMKKYEETPNETA